MHKLLALAAGVAVLGLSGAAGAQPQGEHTRICYPCTTQCYEITYEDGTTLFYCDPPTCDWTQGKPC